MFAAEFGLAFGRLERRLGRKHDELERQNERLDQFAGVVSHDLRNPLNVAQGQLEFAREGRDDLHLEAVDRSLDRMETLIENVLLLAREGDTALDAEPAGLREVLRSCREGIESEEVTLVAATDRAVLADPGRLRQLLGNLVCNAAEHGGDTVTVTLGELDTGIGFYVEDDGEGIAEGDREAVFEPGVSTSSEGTGFGLAIVEKIAEEHGWTVTVTEGADGGARFEFDGVEFVDG